MEWIKKVLGSTNPTIEQMREIGEGNRGPRREEKPFEVSQRYVCRDRIKGRAKQKV